MKLYSYYRSSTSYRLRIALNLKQLEYDIHPISLIAGEQKSADYLAVNPFGSVPALEIDGEIYAQSIAILETLEELYPEMSLWPQDGTARIRARTLAYAIATDLHAVNNLRVLKYLRAEFEADDATVEAWYQHWVAETFAPLEKLLQPILQDKKLPFDKPGMFEIILIPQVYNALRSNCSMGEYPAINRVYTHCVKLPAFIKAAPENQLDAPTL